MDLINYLPENAQALFEAGGWVVVILALMSLMSLTIIIAKLCQFQSVRLESTRTAKQAVEAFRNGETTKAIQCAMKSRNPASQAVLLALRGKRGNFPEEQAYQEVLTFGRDVLADLRLWLRPLEVIAALAPLLGLFGTVLGMIEAFQQLQSAGNQVNPAVLSGGIWKALTTTAVGLAVAMPTLVALQWLNRKVERLAQVMDSTVSRIFTTNLVTQPAPDVDTNASYEPQQSSTT